jgi:hypothetical protein
MTTTTTTNNNIVAEAMWCHHQSLATADKHTALRYEQCLYSLISEMTEVQRASYYLLVDSSSVPPSPHA